MPNIISDEANIDNVNIDTLSSLTTPQALKTKLPLTPTATQKVFQGRETVKNILRHQDKRLLIVIGPCSIHDLKAAMDYAHRLKRLATQVQDTLYLVMRVYFEKPRTTVGWKGLINDPHLNGTFAIEEGLHIARKLLIDIAELGLATATEALDPISPQYLQDLISWSAIGARTTESQTHREMASGLSMPIVFKNGTDGSLDVAINALKSVKHPHGFLGIDQSGQVKVVRTKGNPDAHVVLRGGNNEPNYEATKVALAEQQLAKAGVSTNVMVDASHANSNKDPKLQPVVMENICQQIIQGNQSIIGMMIESFIGWGNQKLTHNLEDLKYGVSITDACIDWETTEQSILAMHSKLQHVLPQRF